jgi:hypothetical protein
VEHGVACAAEAQDSREALIHTYDPVTSMLFLSQIANKENRCAYVTVAHVTLSQLADMLPLLGALSNNDVGFSDEIDAPSASVCTDAPSASVCTDAYTHAASAQVDNASANNPSSDGLNFQPPAQAVHKASASPVRETAADTVSARSLHEIKASEALQKKADQLKQSIRRLEIIRALQAAKEAKETNAKMKSKVNAKETMQKWSER